MHTNIDIGDRIQITIPDETWPDHLYHDAHGIITGYNPDETKYQVKITGNATIEIFAVDIQSFTNTPPIEITKLSELLYGDYITIVTANGDTHHGRITKTDRSMTVLSDSTMIEHDISLNELKARQAAHVDIDSKDPKSELVQYYHEDIGNYDDHITLITDPGPGSSSEPTKIPVDTIRIEKLQQRGHN